MIQVRRLAVAEDSECLANDFLVCNLPVHRSAAAEETDSECYVDGFLVQYLLYHEYILKAHHSLFEELECVLNNVSALLLHFCLSFPVQNSAAGNNSECFANS